MKRFSILFAAIILYSFLAGAQDASVSTSSTAVQNSELKNQRRLDRRQEMSKKFDNASAKQKQRMRQEIAKQNSNEVQPETDAPRGFEEKMAKLENKRGGLEDRKKRFENASPEEKAKMEKRHEMMRSLSPEQKEAAKKEMERHRAEMKKITGFDLPAPVHHEGQ